MVLFLFPIWKVLGSHLIQLILEPPTVETCLLHVIKLKTSKFNWAIYCPVRQVLAPEYGSMFVSTDWMFLCLGRHDDKMGGISRILLSCMIVTKKYMFMWCGMGFEPRRSAFSWLEEVFWWHSCAKWLRILFFWNCLPQGGYFVGRQFWPFWLWKWLLHPKQGRERLLVFWSLRGLDDPCW